MKHYYSVEEISAELGISRQKLNNRINNLGLDKKKLSDKEKEILIEDCKDVLKGKSKQKSISASLENAKSIQTLEISKLNGSTVEQRYEHAKQTFDNIVHYMAICEMNLKDAGISVMTSNGNNAQNPNFKSYNDLLKQYNSLQKTINELEEKLKLTSATTQKAIDD